MQSKSASASEKPKPEGCAGRSEDWKPVRLSNFADAQSRLDSRTEKTDTCWVWHGGCNSSGYGNIKSNGKSYGAHRLAWILKIGPIPEGLCVLHKCDNPKCVNPEHLWLGTNQDNVTDKMLKGRHFTGQRRHGSQCSFAKLTEDDVRTIRNRDYSIRGSKKATAKEYGISQASVTHILNGKNWKYAK